MWTIQLLGGLSAHSPQRALTRFRTQKAASLLAYLAFHPAPQPRELLLDLLWPDAEPEVGRHNLSNALSFLRHQLEPTGVPPGTVILADRASVHLNPAAVKVDVLEFESQLSQAHTEGLSEEERLARLLRAVEGYRGALLPGYYEEWIASEALRLESLFVGGVVRLVPLLLQAGKREAALTYAQRAVSADAMSEEAIYSLMQALIASGQVSQALRAYRQLETRLQEELDTKPSEALQRLAEQVGQGSSVRGTSAVPEITPPLQGAFPRVLSRLAPQEHASDTAIVSDTSGFEPRNPLVGGEFLLRTTTRFFGREEEGERLGKMLSTARTRLVTLTGPGGTGKTRLALEVAAQLVERTADIPEEDAPTRAVFVPVAPLTEVERLFEVALRALGVFPNPKQAPLDQLASVLEARPNTLLVLDNFEQLVEEGALHVHHLMGKSATVKLLVTSRQRLHIEGEREFHLAPLPTSGGAQTPEEMVLVPSIALFVDRAQTVLPDFHLTERNASAIAQLCDYLEGLPLAIELAAARVALLTPARILDQVQSDRLDFLATRRRDAEARHKTLRATLDWSYALLPEPAQAFLAALSVFRGGWTLEAAQALCALNEEETLDWLTLLRDNSLIGVVDTEEGLRFTLLETIREYAQEKRTEGGEEADIRRRHRDYFMALAEQAEPQLEGAEQATWLHRLETEHNNLRAVLAFYETDALGAEANLHLAGALYPFWEMHGDYNEGRAYLRRALEREGAQEATPLRAKALNGAGTLAQRQGDYEAARAHNEEGLAIQRELGDRMGVAASLNKLGDTAYSQGDFKAARSLFEDSLAISRELGDKHGLSDSLNRLGTVILVQGDYEAARICYEEGLAISRELGQMTNIAFSLNGLGSVAHAKGDPEAAWTFVDESLAIRRKVGDRTGIATSLYGLGRVAYEKKDYEASWTLYEESLAIRRELGEKGSIAVLLYSLGCVAYDKGDYNLTRTLIEESLSIFRETQHSYLVHALSRLGHVARETGDYAQAMSLYRESLLLRHKRKNILSIAQSLEDFANLAGRLGKFERATRLLGAAEVVYTTLGHSLSMAEPVEYERTVAAAHAALSEEAFAVAWEEGRAFPLEQAVAYALEEKASTPPEAGA